MTEEQIQADCFQWAFNEYPETRGLLFHVPNGGARDKVTAQKMKQQGVMAGVSDFIFLWHGNAYFIELKRVGGKQSIKQKKWQELVEGQSFQYFIVYSFNEFKELFLKLKDDK